MLLAKWETMLAWSLHDEMKNAFPDVRLDVCHGAVPALTRLRAERFDVAVLGLTFDDMDGLDLIESIRVERLATRIVVVSRRRDERAREFIRAAAVDAFLDAQHATPDELTVTLHRILGGDGDCRPSLQVPVYNGPVLERLLTPTELQVFVILGGGGDDAMAADRLGLSAHTVRTHRRHIMQKLGVSSQPQLMHEAMRRGFVRLSPERVLYPGSERALAERAGRTRPP